MSTRELYNKEPGQIINALWGDVENPDEGDQYLVQWWSDKPHQVLRAVCTAWRKDVAKLRRENKSLLKLLEMKR